MAMFPDNVIGILTRPIDPGALSQAPRGLTSIKSIYITERLNEAFGLGGWFVRDEIMQISEPTTMTKEIKGEMIEVMVPANVVVKAWLELTDYPTFRACAYGGNNNPDLGDAHKGAVTDAISKMCAMYLGIAQDVFKGLPATPMTQAEVVARGKAKAAKLTEDLKASVAAEDAKPPKEDRPAGKMDAEGADAISVDKVTRFKAKCRAAGKTEREYRDILQAMELSSITKCPWKGKLYESLCEWADMPTRRAGIPQP